MKRKRATLESDPPRDNRTRWKRGGSAANRTSAPNRTLQLDRGLIEAVAVASFREQGHGLRSTRLTAT